MQISWKHKLWVFLQNLQGIDVFWVQSRTQEAVSFSFRKSEAWRIPWSQKVTLNNQKEELVIFGGHIFEIRIDAYSESIADLKGS